MQRLPSSLGTLTPSLQKSDGAAAPTPMRPQFENMPGSVNCCSLSFRTILFDSTASRAAGCRSHSPCLFCCVALSSSAEADDEARTWRLDG